MLYTTGRLRGNDVVVFLSGVSTVNAAMNTQVALDHFNITHIVFSGIAGGVNPVLSIGDVVIPARWGQYLEMTFVRETVTDDGIVYSPPNDAIRASFEFMFPRDVTVYSDASPQGEDKYWFDVDAEMLDVAQSVDFADTLLQCGTDDACLTDAPQIVFGGNGVSGPAFVDNARFREYVFNTYKANVLDMESASAAMVAYANGVPFIAFRSLSDLAGGGPGENEIGSFFMIAADNSASVMLEFLEAWAAHTADE